MEIYFDMVLQYLPLQKVCRTTVNNVILQKFFKTLGF